MNRQRNMLSKLTPFILIVLALIAIFSFFHFPSGATSSKRSALADFKMGIIHIVMFEFKEEATAEEIAGVRTSHSLPTPTRGCTPTELTHTNSKPGMRRNARPQGQMSSPDDEEAVSPDGDGWEG